LAEKKDPKKATTSGTAKKEPTKPAAKGKKEVSKKTKVAPQPEVIASSKSSTAAAPGARQGSAAKASNKNQAKSTKEVSKKTKVAPQPERIATSKSSPAAAASARQGSAAKASSKHPAKSKKEVSKKTKVAPLPEVIATSKLSPAAVASARQSSAAKASNKRPAKSAEVVAVKRPKVDPMILKRPKNFGIGGTVQPKRDLTSFVKWPRYIKIQRQRAALYKRLKIPPPINQLFTSLHSQTSTHTEQDGQLQRVCQSPFQVYCFLKQKKRM